jgi:hypothetical protein
VTAPGVRMVSEGGKCPLQRRRVVFLTSTENRKEQDSYYYKENMPTISVKNYDCFPQGYVEINRVADSDPRGSALFWEAGCGFAFE